jgi:hypothetical protein
MLVTLGICGRYSSTEIAAPAKHGSLHHWQFSKATPVRHMRVAFKISYVYYSITKLCRQDAQIIQNLENANVYNSGEGRHQAKNIRGSNLLEVRCKTVQVMNCYCRVSY